MDDFINGVAESIVDEQTQRRHERMFLAAESGNLAVVRELLDEGVDIDFLDSQTKATPLGHATYNGQPKVCKLLLERNADVEKGVPTPLIMANMLAGTPHGKKGIECARVLIEHGANVDADDGTGSGCTALTKAIQNTQRHKDFEMLELLVASGARMVARSQDGAKKWPHLSMALRLNLESGELLTALLRPLRASGQQREWDSDEREDLCRAVLGCANKGWVDILQMLLDVGADVDAVAVPSTDGSVTSRDTQFNFIPGETPLHVAAQARNVDCVELLIKRQADVTVCDSAGRTPFLAACRGGRLECVQLLVGVGCNVLQKDMDERDGGSLVNEALADEKMEQAQHIEHLHRVSISTSIEMLTPAIEMQLRLKIEDIQACIHFVNSVIEEAQQAKAADDALEIARQGLDSGRALLSAATPANHRTACAEVLKQCTHVHATQMDGELQAEALIIRAKCNLGLAKLTKARKDLLAATKLADQAVEGGSSKRAALEASISQVWADCVPCSISRVVSQSAGQA